MLQYLVILLDDTSVSYCHYGNERKERRLIDLDDLKAGILFAMKENLMIQFVYPDYELPQAYWEAIESIDHSKIQPATRTSEDVAVVVFDDWKMLDGYSFRENVAYVLRISKAELFGHIDRISDVPDKVQRLNIVITDVERFDEREVASYRETLAVLAGRLKTLYAKGKSPQVNLLTDRMMLDKMNNCNAGWENLTLAPDGRFYVCPAFYLSADGYAVGDLQNGVDVKNPQLYRLDYAPLCRRCDAYQCKRCVWLNRKTTSEVNTPSHEQCVVAHVERNASRALMAEVRETRAFLPDREIKEIDYLDPFDVKEEN